MINTKRTCAHNLMHTIWHKWPKEEAWIGWRQIWQGSGCNINAVIYVCVRAVIEWMNKEIEREIDRHTDMHFDSRLFILTLSFFSLDMLFLKPNAVHFCQPWNLLESYPKHNVHWHTIHTHSPSIKQTCTLKNSFLLWKAHTQILCLSKPTYISKLAHSRFFFLFEDREAFWGLPIVSAFFL